MIIYVAFEIRMENVWLRDPDQVETLRQEILAFARRLRAQHARPGYPDVEADVEVDRGEMYGGFGEEPPETPGAESEPGSE